VSNSVLRYITGIYQIYIGYISGIYIYQVVISELMMCGCQDPRQFKSVKTGRGPLEEGWKVCLRRITVCKQC